MTKTEYLKFHKKCSEKLVEITKKKNADYSGAGDDPFLNFRKRGTLGFLVRMDDKMSRIESFLQKGFYEVADESFEDTCLDLANYSILLAGYVRSQKQASPVGEQTERTPYEPFKFTKEEISRAAPKFPELPQVDCLSQNNVHEIEPVGDKGHFGVCKHCGLRVKL